VRLRAVWLMPLCALAVHQLRYFVAFGSHAGAQLAHDGHAYLSVVEPLVLVIAAMALGGFIGRLAQAVQTRAGGTGGRRGWVRLWLLCAFTLFAIYCGQELIEGFVSTGHPAGVAGVLGHGGWTAAPIAVLVAALLAAALRVADVLTELTERGGSSVRVPVAAFRLPLQETWSHPKDWRLDPQAGVVAGRAPPLIPSLG
jgi:hypothetical protein